MVVAEVAYGAVVGNDVPGLCRGLACLFRMPLNFQPWIQEIPDTLNSGGCGVGLLGDGLQQCFAPRGCLPDSRHLGARPMQKLMPNPDPPIDAETLMARCFGNVYFAQWLLDELESSSGQRLAEMRQWATQRDGRAMAEAAHALKGAAGTLCATSVQQAAAKIEATSHTGDLSAIDSLVNDLARELDQCLEYLPTLRQRMRGMQRTET